MEVLKIAGVMRASIYSPNHIGNDGAIFTAASDRLRRRGFDVTPYSEEQLYNGEVHEDVILNMCRNTNFITKYITAKRKLTADIPIPIIVAILNGFLDT